MGGGRVNTERCPRLGRGRWCSCAANDARRVRVVSINACVLRVACVCVCVCVRVVGLSVRSLSPPTTANAHTTHATQRNAT